MRFVSTRGGDQATFEEAISRGYARDGGLYLPETLDPISPKTLNSWKRLRFPELCEELFERWVGEEISRMELRGVFGQCFAEFSDERIIPLARLHDEDSLFVAELFHGPSLSFKDFGQQVLNPMLCKLLDHFNRKRGETATLLVSTTGDTGPAAIRACAGLSSLRIICNYPEGQISRLQEQQMTTVDSDNVHVLAFQGGGDDMDAPIKAISTDEAFQLRHRVSSVNSINIARVLAQTVHYFFCYFRAIEAAGEEVGHPVTFAVPCGALGNITAALLAKRLGLPIARLIGGTNVNDIFHRAVSHGDFSRHPEMARTLTEAINIQVPYNFERILFLLTGGDSEAVKALMEEMEGERRMTLSEDVRRGLRQTFQTLVVDDQAMAEEIRLRWRHGYLIDPHTAVGLRAARVHREDAAIVVSIATAHACKFEEALRVALGDAWWEEEMTRKLMPSAARDLAGKQEFRRGVFRAGENWEAQLRGMFEAQRFVLTPRK